MAIRLCDREVYNCLEEDINRTELLMFFLNGCKDEIVVVLDGNYQYSGYITYKSLLSSEHTEDAIIKDRVFLDVNVWSEAATLLEKIDMDIIPVLDANGTLIYFAEHDKELWGMLRKLELCIHWPKLPNMLRKYEFHIVGINELLFKWERFLAQNGIPVTVEGECWKLLGYKESKKKASDNLIEINELCGFIEEIFIRSMYFGADEFKKRDIKSLRNLKDVVVWTTASEEAIQQYDLLLKNGIVSDEICSLDNNFKKRLFGKQVAKKNQIMQLYGNGSFFLLGKADNVKVEEAAECLYRKFGTFDQIYVAADFKYDVVVPVTVMKHIGTVVLIGDEELCLYFKNMYLKVCNVLYVDSDICFDESAKLYKDAIWFYIDYSLKYLNGFIPAFHKCRNNGIYLSDYFLKNVQYLLKDKSLVNEEIDHSLDNINFLVEDIVFDKVMPSEVKVVFLMTSHSYFWDSIEPLYKKYKENGTQCAIIFPDMKSLRLLSEIKLLERMKKNILRLRKDGAICMEYSNNSIYEHSYHLCFFCMGNGNETNLPIRLRRRCKYIVGVQILAYYTHIYIGNLKFNDVFSKEIISKIDFMVVSSFIKKWIQEKVHIADEKLLPFGFPKMDLLYKNLNDSKQEIPQEWRNKAKGKKVYLFTTYELESDWLNCFQDETKLLIWRPHPLTLTQNTRYIEELKSRKKLNIIIDDKESYSCSFLLSDCLISPLCSSPLVNYLYMDKPVFIMDAETRVHVDGIDLREEPWYQACYNNLEMKIEDFIQMVQNGEYFAFEKKLKHSIMMKEGIDGHVCDRIFDFFQKK